MPGLFGLPHAPSEYNWNLLHQAKWPTPDGNQYLCMYVYAYWFISQKMRSFSVLAAGYLASADSRRFSSSIWSAVSLELEFYSGQRRTREPGSGSVLYWRRRDTTPFLQKM